MNILSSSKAFFGFDKKITAGASGAGDAVMRYLKNLINREDLVKDISARYQQAQRLPSGEREAAYVRTYFDYEGFIVKNKPLITKREFTKEGLREEVKRNVNIQELAAPFRLIFLPDSEQALYLYGFGINDLASAMIRNLGLAQCNKIIKTITANTLLEDMVAVQETGIDPGVIYKRMPKGTTVEDVVPIIKNLYQMLYDSNKDFLGEREAASIVRRTYDFIAKRYDYDLVSRFLVVTPPGILEIERLGVLSREELEKKVIVRTKESDEKREKLEQTVAELEKANKELESTKAAVLNLLEDGRALDEQLKKERDRAQAIISSMDEGLFVVDKEYKVVLMNKAAEKLLGIPAIDAVGKDLTGLVSIFKDGKELPQNERPVGKTLQSGEQIAYGLGDNVQAVARSGTKFFIALSTVPLLGSGGTVTGAMVIFRNINEEKKLDDAKTGFISIASHQLRTPLTSMRWFSEMLLAGDAGALNEEQKHFVERVYQGTDRMIDLVNLLLQIARVEGGRIKIEPVRIDFKTLTNGVALTLKAILDKKMQTVEVTADADPLPLILMDQEVVWQVVQNLLSNASRYSPEKAVIKVSISTKGSMLEYAVKDSGIGIPKDQQAGIFEKFFRAENALKTVPEGSGLGLSLVKSLVEEWDGKVWFESEENKGATFYFTVPRSGMKKRAGEVGLKV